MIFDKFKKTKAQKEEDKVQAEINDGFQKLFEAAHLLGWSVGKHIDRYDGVVLGSDSFLDYVVGTKKSWERMKLRLPPAKMVELPNIDDKEGT